MNITISDELLKGLELTPREAVLDFAIGLNTERKVTLGRAATIASLSQTEFQKELGRRRISVHYDLQDLEVDLKTVRETPDK